jgi:LPS sulfotransferase NodH
MVENNTKKFFVVGLGRCGSNLLVELLNKSRSSAGIKLRCYDELFNTDVYSLEKSLETIRNPEEGITYLGCKVLYYQFINYLGGGIETLKYDIIDTVFGGDSTIVHLTRKNKTKQFISTYLATRENKWVYDKYYVPNKFEIPLDKAREFCYNYDLVNRLVVEPYIKDRSGVINISYEDLIKDNTGESNRILSSLGAPKILGNVSTTIVRQSDDTIYSKITNLRDIEDIVGMSVSAF